MRLLAHTEPDRARMPTREHGTFARPTLAAVSDRAVP
jgi:hypothetical protein